MPLHKSSRASRLDPTMISAPLGDFRHTMHIGRGGDAFGDTSFLSTLGPSPTSSDLGSPENIPGVDPDYLQSDEPSCPHLDEPRHSESVSSLTLELELDLGPSMLGDVLGVMDGLGLDHDVFSTSHQLETKQGGAATGMSTSVKTGLNGKILVGSEEDELRDSRSRTPDVKQKGLRPKVRFSDKREEIIQQTSDQGEGQGLDVQEENQMAYSSLTKDEGERGKSRVEEDEEEEEAAVTNNPLDFPPSPASSHSLDGDEAVPLDRRRMDSSHSETESEEEDEEGETGRGYTFEDEFDDEIGL